MNDALLWIGVVTFISFPLIGYFDEHAYPTIHGITATLFFVSTAVYGNMLSHCANKHKDEFKTDNCWISMLYWVGWAMIAVMVIFGLSFLWNWYVPVWEWILGVLYINFHTLVGIKNPYYDSVAPIKDEEPEVFIKDYEIMI